MRNLLLVLLLVSVCSMVEAQNNVVEHLAQRNISGASVIVKSNIDVEFSQPLTVDVVRGHRVRIFFDNRQDSREQAQEAEVKFKEIYPGLKLYHEYVSPYFRVTVGDFLSRLEAVALCGKLKYEFPTAFVVSQDIPYDLVLNAPDPYLIAPDSLDVVSSDSVALGVPISLSSW